VSLSPEIGLFKTSNSSHNLVAEPGFENIDIVPPKSGAFTLY